MSKASSGGPAPRPHPDLSLLGSAAVRTLDSQVYIVGLGIPEKGAATVEALEVLRRCRTIFVPDPEDGFFRRLCGDARPHGVPGSPTRDGMDPAVVAPVLAAVSPEGPVAFAIYGHPLYYEPITQYLLGECLRRGLSVSVVSGLSAVDAVLSVLQQALGFGWGLQIGDTQFFCGQDPDPRMAVLIYKVAMEPGNQDLLLDALARSYPKSARLAIVERENYQAPSDRVEWLTVGAFRARLKKPLGLYATVFLPPLTPPPAR